MKIKIFKGFLIIFTILMVSGILSSLKDNSHQDITNIVNEFEQVSEYNTNGYTSIEPFDEDNANIFGEINNKVGQGISNGISKGIDLLFEVLQKLVS